MITVQAKYNAQSVVAIAIAVCFIISTLIPPLYQTRQVSAIGPIVNLSDNDDNSISPRIAASEENVYVVWQDFTPSEVLFRASSNNGADFDDTINLSANSGVSRSPQIAASGDNVYVVWQDRSSGTNEIWFAASANNGADFDSTKNVSNNTSSSTIPQIAASGDNVYVVWQDDNSGNNDIWFAASANNGADFSVINVSDDGGGSSAAQIAANGDNAYVVWVDTPVGSANLEVMLSRVEGGVASTPMNVSKTSDPSGSPQLASDGGSNVYVVWKDTIEGKDDILFGASADSASSFSPSVNISNNTGSSDSPQVLISKDNNIRAVWQDDSLDDGSFEIYLKSSADGGMTFGDLVNVSNNDDSSLSPHLAESDGGIAYVVWQDGPLGGNSDVFVRADVASQEEKIVMINPVADTSPRWDIDLVIVSGSSINAEDGDTVTIDWGDGSSDTGIDISSDGSWGPANHTYDADSIDTNPNMIVGQMVASDGSTVLATSDPVWIQVQKHETILVLNSIQSVIQGEDIVVTGSLTDAGMSSGIDGRTITFNGTGADNLGDVATEADGSFTTAGPSPNSVENGLQVIANFIGDSIYEASISEAETFDTVGNDSLSFDVSAGADSFVDLTGLSINASIIFENVTEAGKVFVQECTSPSDDRYIFPNPLEICLVISPALELAPGSSAFITTSFAGKDIPITFTESDIAIFHLPSVGPTTDISSSKDLEEKTVTGKLEDFSTFVTGVALHNQKPEGALRHQVFLGDNQTAELRSIADTTNSSESAQAFFDKTSYEVTDHAILTVIDHYGNIDPDASDIIYAAIQSDTSALNEDPTLQSITIRLRENDTNSGAFVGTFTFTGEVSSGSSLQVAEGDELSVFYSSGSRTKLVLDGVVEAGVVDILDYIVDIDFPQKAIGGAVNFDLPDGHAKLSEDGKITVVMSYANSKLLGDEPSELRVFQKRDVGGESVWIDITLRDEDGNVIGVDEQAMTVTAETTIIGPITLAVDTGGIGGGGGGLPRPGNGIVLDFVASVAIQSSGNDDSPSSSSGGSTGGGRDRQAVDLTTYQSSYFETKPLEKIQILDSAFVNSMDAQTDEVSEGEWVSLSTEFKNYQMVPQTYTVIFMVTDQNEVTSSIHIQSGVADPGQTVALSESWSSFEPQTYEFRIFVWDDLSDSPQPLSEPKMLTLNVVQK